MIRQKTIQKAVHVLNDARTCCVQYGKLTEHDRLAITSRHNTDKNIISFAVQLGFFNNNNRTIVLNHPATFTESEAKAVIKKRNEYKHEWKKNKTPKTKSTTKTINPETIEKTIKCLNDARLHCINFDYINIFHSKRICRIHKTDQTILDFARKCGFFSDVDGRVKLNHPGVFIDKEAIEVINARNAYQNSLVKKSVKTKTTKTKPISEKEKAIEKKQPEYETKTISILWGLIKVTI